MLEKGTIPLSLRKVVTACCSNCQLQKEFLPRPLPVILEDPGVLKWGGAEGSKLGSPYLLLIVASFLASL
jgi:hypothetical protein